MARDGNLRVADVVAELVRRGIPRSDCESHHVDDGPYWWALHPQEAPEWTAKERPRTVLCYSNHSRDDLNDIQLAVSTCECCEVIVRTELLDSDGYTFAAFPYWPGLDRAEQIWRQMRMEWELEMERFMAREQA